MATLEHLCRAFLIGAVVCDDVPTRDALLGAAAGLVNKVDAPVAANGLIAMVEDLGPFSRVLCLACMRYAFFCLFSDIDYMTWCHVSAAAGQATAQQRVSILAWLAKALVMRAHAHAPTVINALLALLDSPSDGQVGGLERWRHGMHSNDPRWKISITVFGFASHIPLNHSRVQLAADAVRVLLADSPYWLSLDVHAHVRLMYKQRFFLEHVPRFVQARLCHVATCNDSTLSIFCSLTPTWCVWVCVCVELPASVHGGAGMLPTRAVIHHVRGAISSSYRRTTLNPPPSPPGDYHGAIPYRSS